MGRKSLRKAELLMYQTGEALISCPTGLYVGKADRAAGSAAAGSSTELMQFSRNFIIARTRKRVTADGGTSVMVV
jgi:hypothetical protein